MNCEVCNSKDVIYSGIDAFVLEVIDKVEKICYPCANEQLKIKKGAL